jgi:PTH1 family peptidyl-tRNA hydrolase
VNNARPVRNGSFRAVKLPVELSNGASECGRKNLVFQAGFLKPMTGICTGTKMLVGLGNPGSEYEDTRHNIGFKVIDSLADRLGVKVKRRKFSARFGEAEFADKKLILLKPWQFMNCSGQAVATAVGFYKLPLSDLLVVTDDMALEPGRIRIRAKGSAGGHNGLTDIIDKLGTNEFARCRIGIGRCGEQIAYDYVLDKPTETEKPLLNEAIDIALDAVLCWIEYGVEQAMNEFNSS